MTERLTYYGFSKPSDYKGNEPLIYNRCLSRHTLSCSLIESAMFSGILTWYLNIYARCRENRNNQEPLTNEDIHCRVLL